MMPELSGRPNDRRFIFGTIGRVLGGAVKGFVGSGGNPLGAITGGIRGATGGGTPRTVTVPQIQSPVPGRVMLPASNLPVSIPGRSFTGGPPPGPTITRCSPGFFLDPRTGQCIPLETRAKVPGVTGVVQRFLPGGESGFVEFGEAVMTPSGAALQPGIRTTEVSVCPRGTVLGKDGLCHNKRDIRNSDRMWPRGRRPLLTGGEMRAITIASRAATKLKTKQKQLEELGLLKKPTTRKRKALPAGHTATVSHT